MVGTVEVALSRDLINRAKRRLSYQQTIVAKWDLSSSSSNAEFRQLCSTMQVKLDRLTEQHDELVSAAGQARLRQALS